MDPRLLLLQARYDDDPMRGQEHRCFVDHTGLPPEAIRIHDLLQGPPESDLVARSDALLIGGSGDFLVSRADLPRVDATYAFLRQLVESGKPVFASCFGFQLLVEGLGGEIVYDPDRVEVGTHSVWLTPEGQADELTGSLPVSFDAQMGHKDRAATLPPGTVHLAGTDLVPLQAFRIAGKPVWATQFHPELAARDNQERYERYISAYEGLGPQDGGDQVEFRDSGECEKLLFRFLELL